MEGSVRLPSLAYDYQQGGQTGEINSITDRERRAGVVSLIRQTRSPGSLAAGVP
jgi:hypothetical protein